MSDAFNIDETLERLGRRIAELREDAGQTQAEFAAQLGMALTNYQRIEHGEQNVTVRTLVRIARSLDVEWSTLTTSPATPRRTRGRPRKRR